MAKAKLQLTKNDVVAQKKIEKRKQEIKKEPSTLLGMPTVAQSPVEQAVEGFSCKSQLS